MVSWVEEASGKRMASETRKNFVRGAKELDLVYSGLQDTMETASQEVAKIAKEYNVDFRTAGLISAMTKMSVVHQLAGLRSSPINKKN